MFTFNHLHRLPTPKTHFNWLISSLTPGQYRDSVTPNEHILEPADFNAGHLPSAPRRAAMASMVGVDRHLQDGAPALPGARTAVRQTQPNPSALAQFATLAGSRHNLVISQYEIYTAWVHVITRKRLREFAAKHREAAEPLGAWYAIMSQTDFGSFADLKRVFRSVDKVGKFTVFDIGGNKFRLIAAIHYNRKKIYIRHVLTHVEYDSDKWKE